jgi:DNA-binding transcriptional MocR family regulator
VQELARMRGIEVHAVTEHGRAEREWHRIADRTLLLGYSSLEERQIRDGVAGLAYALQDHRRAAAG